MGVQETTREYRLRQWMRIISERNVSGKTVKNWCEEQGIKPKSCYYWQ